MGLRLTILLCLALLITGCGGSGGNVGPTSINLSGGSNSGNQFGSGGPNSGPNGGPAEEAVGPGTGTPVGFIPTDTPTTPTTPTTIVAIQVAPNPVVLSIAASLTLAVSGTSEAGTTVTLPGTTTATLSYLSANPAIASVSASGVVTGVAAGSTSITVTVDNLGTQLTQTVPVTVTPAGTVVSPAVAYIFVANPPPNGGGGSVVSLAIAPDGTLSVVDTDANVNRPLAVAASPTQNFVYALNVSNFQGTTPSVSIFSTDLVNGALTFLPPVAPSVVASPSFLVIDPSGRFAYLTTANGVGGYVVEANGSLTPNPGAVASGTPRSMPTFNGNGSVLYITDGNDDSIDVLNVDTTNGNLSVRQLDFPVEAGDAPIASALSSDKNYLYVANNDSLSVSSYSNAAAGDLSLAFNAPTNSAPRALAVHPSLPAMYVGGGLGRANTIQSYTTGFNGSLTPLGAPLPVGVLLSNILVAPSGRYVYAVCAGFLPEIPATIDAYSVDPVTGALSALTSYTFPQLSSPRDAAIVSAQGR